VTASAGMSSRERTIRAVERRGPDRLPAYYSVLPGAREPYRQPLADLWADHAPDIVLFGYSESEEFSGRTGTPAVDRWGARWLSASDDTKGQVVDHPLRDWSALGDFEWPSPSGWPEYGRAREFIAKDNHEHYILGDGDTLFQRMMYLRGVEELFVDLALGRAEVLELRDRICRYMHGRVRNWQDLGVDGIYFRDDWGSQNGLLIRPAMWRQVFKPAYGALVEAAHEGGCHVFFHSDGMIADILPDLVEIGVDVIHPQMPLLGARWLAEEYGGRVSFQCDPDRQRVLPRGSARQVSEHISGIVDVLARYEGGLIGWGEIGPDVPLENVRAMVRAFAGWRPARSQPSG